MRVDDPYPPQTAAWRQVRTMGVGKVSSTIIMIVSNLLPPSQHKATPTHPLTSGYEQLHAVGVATEACHVHGQHSPRPSAHHLLGRSIADQGLGDRGVAMAGSNMEGCVVLFVLNIHPGTCAQANMTHRERSQGLFNLHRHVYMWIYQTSYTSSLTITV